MAVLKSKMAAAKKKSDEETKILHEKKSINNI